jgi:hypothetical protein
MTPRKTSVAIAAMGACFGSPTGKEGDMAEKDVAALVRGSPPAGGEGLSANAFRGLAMHSKTRRCSTQRMLKLPLSLNAAIESKR